MAASSPFVLSIEPTGGEAFIAPFHLGTDLEVAKSLASERFHGRTACGLPTCTVALMRDRKLIAVYDGEWN